MKLLADKAERGTENLGLGHFPGGSGVGLAPKFGQRWAGGGPLPAPYV